MQEAEYITIISNRRKEKIRKDQILYVRSRRKYLEVHLYERIVYKTFMPLWELEKELGEGFIEVHRGCIVAERTIDRIADRIYLMNGEASAGGRFPLFARHGRALTGASPEHAQVVGNV